MSNYIAHGKRGGEVRVIFRLSCFFVGIWFIGNWHIYSMQEEHIPESEPKLALYSNPSSLRRLGVIAAAKIPDFYKKPIPENIVEDIKSQVQFDHGFEYIVAVQDKMYAKYGERYLYPETPNYSKVSIKFRKKQEKACQYIDEHYSHFYQRADYTDINNLSAAQWHADSKHILLACDKHAIHCVDVNTLSSTKEFKGHTNTITHIQSFLDQIVSASEDQTIKQWDITTKSCIMHYKFEDAITDLIAHDDHEFLIGDKNKGVMLWDIRDNKILQLLNCSGKKIKISPCGDSQNLYAICINKSTVFIIDKRYPKKRLWEDVGSDISLVFPQSNTVIAIPRIAIYPEGYQKSITSYTFHTVEGKECIKKNELYLKSYRKHLYSAAQNYLPLRNGALHPKKELIAISAPKSIILWNWDKTESEPIFLKHSSCGQLAGIYFSPDGKRLLLTNTRSVVVWSLPSFEELRQHLQSNKKQGKRCVVC